MVAGLNPVNRTKKCIAPCYERSSFRFDDRKEVLIVGVEGGVDQ